MATPIALCFVNLFFDLFIAHYHLKAMVESLSNSRHFGIWARVLNNQGLTGRLLLVSKICGMVLIPGPGIRAGMLDPSEIRDFPAQLRRLLATKAALMAITVAWLLVAHVLSKLSE